MTKKITITLEEELASMAINSGKKKTQVIIEALQNYLYIHDDARASLGL